MNLPFRLTKNDAFNVVVALAYLAVLSFLLYVHVFWRDEVQAWLIARDSATIPDLISNLGFEGHPPLWYLLLMVPSHLGFGAGAMLWLQGALSLATICVVLWLSPFSRLEKLLFPFGAITLIQYGALARSYTLGFLLTVLICAAWKRRYERPILTAALASALANVHILFSICTIALALAYAAGRPSPRERPSRKELAAGLILLLGLGVAIAVAVPNESSGYATEWYFNWSINRLDLRVRALGSILGDDTRLEQGVIAACALVLFLLLIRKNTSAAVFLAAAVTGISVFLYIKYPGGSWHHGIFFFILIAAAWMARDEPDSRSPFLRTALLAVLAVNLVPVGNSLLRAWERPRSYAAAAAIFIEDHGWEHQPLIGSPYAVTLLGYLKTEGMYYLGAQRRNSFLVLDKSPLEGYDVPSAVERAAHDVAGPATLVLYVPGEVPDLTAQGFMRVAVFNDPRPLTDESFAVYRREAPPPN